MSNVNTSNAAQGILNLAKVVMGNAAFDTTIRAIVQEKVDNTTGKFKLQYQDSVFYAFADDIKTNYTKGTEVFVLVPQNDFTQDKRIIGSVKTLGEDYVGVFTDDERYKKIGASAFGETNGGEQSFGIRSAWKENDESPLKNSESILPLSLDSNFLNYLRQDSVDGIWLEATFTTENLEWVENANYGLTVEFNLKDNKILDLTIDTNNMVGNPFSLYDDRQVVVFGLSGEETIDFADIESIKSVSLWSKDFRTSVKEEDIFVKNIKMYAVSAIEEEQLNAPRAEIWTPQGTYVAANSSVELIGRLRIEGKIQDNVKYFWFEENLSINKDSGASYHPYGGRGWKLLNETTSIEDGTFKIRDIDKNTLLVYDNELTGTEETDILPIQLDIPKKLYKCVIAKSDSERYETTVEVTNNAIEINPYEIKQKQGEQVIEVGSSIALEEGGSISFVVYKGDDQQTSVSWYKKDLFDTEWSSINGDGNNTNQLTISYSHISTQKQIRAMVNGVMTQTVTLIAEAEIPDPTPQYQLVITNADQTFVYDEDGRSPTHPAKTFRDNEPKLLSFKLYDTYAPSGVYDITNQIDRFKWEINASGLINSISNNEWQQKPETEWTGSWNQLNFTLKDAWRYDTVDNQITLTVEYQSDSSNPATKATITAKTNFTFLKEGDPGTNGTGVAIVIQKKENTNSYYADVYKGTIRTTEVEVKWQIFSSTVAIGNWNSELVPSGKSFTPTSFSEGEVIVCKYTEDNKDYFGYYVADPSNEKTPPSSKYVVYAADGTNPKYANDLPSDIKEKIPKTFNSNLAEDNGIIVQDGITLLASLNRHAFSMVNKWDGNLNIDTDNNCVLAQSVIAGTKDEVNSFTGIIIGEIGKTGFDSKTGLFGYNAGVQTAFISATDGSATFGSSKGAQFKIDIDLTPAGDSSDKDKSSVEFTVPYKTDNTNTWSDKSIFKISSSDYYLKSANFSDTTSTISGTKIDLEDGSIVSRNFQISRNGDATFSGTVNADGGHFSNGVTLGDGEMEVGTMLNNLSNKIEQVRAVVTNPSTTASGSIQFQYKTSDSSEWQKTTPVTIPKEHEVNWGDLRGQLNQIKGDGLYWTKTDEDGNPTDEASLYAQFSAITTGLVSIKQGSTTYGGVGFATGDDGSNNNTTGVMLAASDEKSPSQYIIVTDSGARMQIDTANVYLNSSDFVIPTGTGFKFHSYQVEIET